MQTRTRSLFDRGSRGCGGTNERGSAAAESIIVLPVLFLIFFAVVQGAMWIHAGNIAQAAASSAYNESRLYQATETDGVKAGYTTAEQAGTILSNVSVSVARDAESVTVTVTGSAPSLIPGMPIAVDRTVSGPVERWIEQ